MRRGLPCCCDGGVSSSDPSTRSTRWQEGGRLRPLAVGLALVSVLAVAVGLVATTAPAPSAPTQPLASPSESPCTYPSGICPAPDVCPARVRHSLAELERLRPGVESMIDGVFYSVGFGDGTIDVDLFPGHEQLAASLEQRFGDAVSIRMGTTRYCGGPGTSGRCADVQGATTLPPGLHLALTLEHDTVPRTAPTVQAALKVRYNGPGMFAISTGQPIIASLVKSGTRMVIGTNTGTVAGTGLSLRLRRGQQSTIGVIIGLSRCDGGLGSAVPPGTYGVRASLGPDGRPPYYLAPEAALTIR